MLTAQFVEQVRVLDTPIAVGTFETTLAQISGWAAARESKAIFFCNVHSVTTARMNPAFAATLKQANLCLPDGAPVAYMVRRSGHTGQKRLSGPDLMGAYLKLANSRKETIFLYGSTPATLRLLTARLAKTFPDLVVHAYSPPFRGLTPEENAQVADMINRSGALTVWVALGCPKQESFIIEQLGRINAVMLGVGAAFAFHAGAIQRAPLWIQRSGLEWLHRLVSDPKRLWKRYLLTNSAFIFYVGTDFVAKLFRRISLGTEKADKATARL